MKVHHGLLLDDGAQACRSKDCWFNLRGPQGLDDPLSPTAPTMAIQVLEQGNGVRRGGLKVYPHSEVHKVVGG